MSHFIYSFQIEPDTSLDSLEELHFQWLPKPYQIKIKVQQLHITCTLILYITINIHVHTYMYMYLNQCFPRINITWGSVSVVCDVWSIMFNQCYKTVFLRINFEINGWGSAMVPSFRGNTA